MFSSFSTNPVITITFDGQDTRTKKSVKVSGTETAEIPVYFGSEIIKGVVDVGVPSGKKIEHQGIRIEMIGQTGAKKLGSLQEGLHFNASCTIYCRAASQYIPDIVH